MKWLIAILISYSLVQGVDKKDFPTLPPMVHDLNQALLDDRVLVSEDSKYKIIPHDYNMENVTFYVIPQKGRTIVISGYVCGPEARLNVEGAIGSTSGNTVGPIFYLVQRNETTYELICTSNRKVLGTFNTKNENIYQKY